MSRVQLADDPGTSPGRRGTVTVLVLAGLAQAAVCLGTFSMGLVWGGVTFAVAMTVSLFGLAAVAVLARRRPPLAFLVPVVSVALSVALYQANESYLEATACTDAQLAAVATVDPPPGGRHDFEGESLNGCIARYRTDLPADSVTAHYRSELRREGWQIRGGAFAEGVAGEKDDIIIDVTATGPLEDGLVIVSVFDKPEYWD